MQCTSPVLLRWLFVQGMVVVDASSPRVFGEAPSDLGQPKHGGDVGWDRLTSSMHAFMMSSPRPSQQDFNVTLKSTHNGQPDRHIRSQHQPRGSL